MSAARTPGLVRCGSLAGLFGWLACVTLASAQLPGDANGDRLIDERDVFLAQKIRGAEGQKIVAVLGAGHVPGILEEIHHEKPLEPLQEIPKPALWPRLLKWGIPLAIIGLLVYGFIRGGAEQRVSETLTIDVKPGWKKGTKITFPEKGDESPGVIAADIIFVVDEKKHPQFERDGNDLITTKVVDLHEALLGTSVFITTLNGKSINVEIPEIVSPKYVKVLVGEGMPLSKSPNSKGDMKIKFDIRFPKELTGEQKAQLKSILGEAQY